MIIGKSVEITMKANYSHAISNAHHFAIMINAHTKTQNSKEGTIVTKVQFLIANVFHQR